MVFSISRRKFFAIARQIFTAMQGNLSGIKVIVFNYYNRLALGEGLDANQVIDIELIRAETAGYRLFLEFRIFGTVRYEEGSNHDDAVHVLDRVIYARTPKEAKDYCTALVADFERSYGWRTNYRHRIRLVNSKSRVILTLTS